MKRESSYPLGPQRFRLLCRQPTLSNFAILSFTYQLVSRAGEFTGRKMMSGAVDSSKNDRKTVTSFAYCLVRVHSDSLLVNVILPVVEILNKLIDPGLQQDLLIIPTREASASAGKAVSTDKSKLDRFSAC